MMVHYLENALKQRVIETEGRTGREEASLLRVLTCDSEKVTDYFQSQPVQRERDPMFLTST